MKNDHMPILLALFELVGGYFGLMGLGWILAGEIRRGLLLFVGYALLLGLGAILVFFSFGCLAAIFGPLHIIAPLISAIKVYEWMR